MGQINIQEIIKEISPLYNSYKQSSRKIKGTDALYIMWDIGNILKQNINASNMAPHSLYRKIYGKAEGKSDITQKSYITREFLGRAYRIRNIFKNKEEIKKDLPDLNSFISFREAMPFFDNDKYILRGEEREKLLFILNAKESPGSVLKKIRLLQSEKIGKKNPRNQRLKELEPRKEIFITFYNYLYNLIKNEEHRSLRNEIETIDGSLILRLASITSALATEGLKFEEVPEIEINNKWKDYTNLLRSLSTQTDAKERRRFRRLISPERIVRLAEMLLKIVEK